jgi:hypothetical protein
MFGGMAPDDTRDDGHESGTPGPSPEPAPAETPANQAPADKAAAGVAAANKAANEPDRTPAWALGVKAIGGLLAVSVGVIALALIACLAFAVEDSTTTPIVTGCVTAIGSIVGAYFGVKVGTDGTSTAIKAQQQSANNAQIASLYVSPDHADNVSSHLTGGGTPQDDG